MAFYAESDYAESICPNKERYRQTLEGYIGHPYVASIIARCNIDGRLLGYFHIFATNGFTDSLIGESFQFYVAPEARGTGVARRLVSNAIEQFRSWGCVRAYVEASANFCDSGKNLSQFKNLFKKFGFEPVGVTMKLEF